MARSNEPIFWSLFSAGGVVTALFSPVFIFLIGFGEATGRFSAARAYYRLCGLIPEPFAKILLFAVIVLPMFHWAHRFRFTLVDLGLRGLKRPIAVLCYGVAIAVIPVAAVVLWRL